MSISDCNWEQEERHTRLLWDVHQENEKALDRPYQDFQDAAAYLAARLAALYGGGGGGASTESTGAGAPTVGVDAHKLNGWGAQLEGDAVDAVTAALRHLSARRIWSTRTTDNNLNIRDFLAKFPNMRTHVETVACRFLEPAVESSEIAEDALYPQSCISFDMQLRMQALGEEELLFQYVDFVTDVVHTWHGAVDEAQRVAAVECRDFPALADYMHDVKGEDARNKIVMASRLCQLHGLRVLTWGSDTVRFRAALPPPLRLRCAVPAPSAHPPTWISSMSDNRDAEDTRGAVHAVHFRLPDRPCPQLEMQLDAPTGKIVEIAPHYHDAPIHEPESIGVMLLGISTAAISVAGTLHGTQRVHLDPSTVTLASLVAGVAGLCAGLCLGSRVLAHLRARTMWLLFNDWLDTDMCGKKSLHESLIEEVSDNSDAGGSSVSSLSMPLPRSKTD